MHKDAKAERKDPKTRNTPEIGLLRRPVGR
jgi:hypothetical protein